MASDSVARNPFRYFGLLRSSMEDTCPKRELNPNRARFLVCRSLFTNLRNLLKNVYLYRLGWAS